MANFPGAGQPSNAVPGGASPNFADIPALELVSDISGSYVDIALTQNAWTELVYDCAALDATTNNLFESDGLGTSTYIGEEPAMMVFESEFCAGAVSGIVLSHQAIWRNGMPVAPTRKSVFGVFDCPDISSRIPVQYGDKISNAVLNLENSVDFRLVGLTVRGTFDGAMTEAEINGAELFENPNITSTDGFAVNVNATISASAGELTIESTAASGGAIATVNGLTVGRPYRIEISAKRGAQGTLQDVQAFGLVIRANTAILTTGFVTYIIDTVADGITGDIDLNAALGGAAGDELVINYLSVKEYL